MNTVIDDYSIKNLYFYPEKKEKSFRLTTLSIISKVNMEDM